MKVEYLKISSFPNLYENADSENSSEIAVSVNGNPGITDVLVDENHPTESFDKIVMPDKKTVIDMHEVNTIIRDAINQLGEIVGKHIKVLFASMPIIIDVTTVKTMATDGEYIYINPGFVMYLWNLGGESVIYVAYVLLHEMFHATLGHVEDFNHNTGKYSDSLRVNNAQDYTINYIIEHCIPDDDMEYVFSGATEEAGGLINDAFAGMDWPEIYGKIKPEIKKDTREKVKMSEAWLKGVKLGIEQRMQELRDEHKIK